jgi:hypothetical protein
MHWSRHPRIHWALACVLVFSCAGVLVELVPGPLSAEASTPVTPTYTVTMLKNPPGAYALSSPSVVAISDDGDVIGSAVFYPKKPGSSPLDDAVIWHDGKPTNIVSEMHGGDPAGINATGEIVGNCPNETCAFTLNNGVYTVLKRLANAYGINDSGQVVGWNGNPFTYAAVWTNGVVTRMADATADGWGVAINDKGHVAGANPQPAGTGPANQPAFWRGDKYYNLEPAGYCYGQTSGLNNSDEVVGYIAAAGTCSEQPEAFVWQSGKFTNLNPLTGQAFSYANAINNAGTIVGEALGYSEVPSAWIYSHGTLTYLQNLIGTGSKWFLQDAVGINNSGQIIGYGLYDNKTESFLLTPKT